MSLTVSGLIEALLGGMQPCAMGGLYGRAKDYCDYNSKSLEPQRVLAEMADFEI